MAHEIYADRFIARGTAAWHRLGQVFAQDEQLEVEEAFRRARLDIDIRKLPIFTETPAGDRLIVSDQMALTRLAQADRGPEVLAVVHRDYPFMGNMEVAALVGELARQSGWGLETAGALKRGELIFVTLKVGEYAVAGRDPVTEYILFSDTRDGSAMAEIALVPVRVVCANTLRWGLDTATERVRIPHYAASFKVDVEWTLGAIAALRGAQVQARGAFDALAARKIDAEERGHIWRATYPQAPRPERHALVAAAEAAGHDVSAQVARYLGQLKEWEQWTVETERRRRDAEVMYEELAPEFGRDDLAGTGWHVWNTITQAEDTRIGNGTTAGALARSAQSTVFGVRAETKERAFRACLGGFESEEAAAFDPRALVAARA